MIQKPAFAPSLAVLSGSFAVVDIETTGLDPNRDEIIEIAALVVSSKSYVPVFEFSALVKPQRPLPLEITRLTGIEQAHLDERGRSLDEGMRRLIAVVGNLPLFAHHSAFDQAFLTRAAQIMGKPQGQTRLFLATQPANPDAASACLSRSSTPTQTIFNARAR